MLLAARSLRLYLPKEWAKDRSVGKGLVSASVKFQRKWDRVWVDAHRRDEPLARIKS